MYAYNYEVKGNPEALVDIAELMKSSKYVINWFNFNTGDVYWDSNGNKYEVVVNHDIKQVILN